MIEYFILVAGALLAGLLAEGLGIRSVWLVLPLALGAIPSVYAMFIGSPYVPTDANTVRRMIHLAKIRPGEHAADLGCGDGRLVEAASQRGAKSVGFELSIYLYWTAKILRRGDIRYQNFWNADLSEMDIVFLYLEKRFLSRFEKELWPQLKSGCRVIVNTFPLPSLEPTQTDANVYRYDKT